MPQTWIHIIMLKVAPTIDAVIKISPPSCLLEIMKLTFLTISFISFFVPILQIKRKLVYLFDSVNYLFFFLKLFVTRINCYFLLGPFASLRVGGAHINSIYLRPCDKALSPPRPLGNGQK